MFEHDELSDSELGHLLKKWEAPAAPGRLRAVVFAEEAVPWWRRAWSASFRVPLPVAVAVGVALAIGAWQWRRPAETAREVVRTERVEVPVWKDRVVVKTVYRDRMMGESALRPVGELRPRIIRTNDEQ